MQPQMDMVEISTPKNGEKRSRLRFCDDEHNNGNSSSSVGKDRLSALPEILLVEILSLLPIESAAATSALSHRWRHLWTQLTRLRFTGDDSPMWRSLNDAGEYHKLCTIIDHIFRQLASPKIHSFHLDLQFNPPPPKQLESCCFSLQSWVRQICARNVEEIKVFLPGNSVKPLPTCVFESQSLVVLKLTAYHEFFTYNLPENRVISLPNLKKLWIELSDTHRELMGLLFKSCPRLEDLYLYVLWWEKDYFVDISAQNLKRLEIKAMGPFQVSRFRIDAPKLVYLKTCHESSLPAYCFVKGSSGLLEAEIRVGKGHYDGSDYLGETSELVKGIYVVRSLYLSYFIFDSLYNMHDGNMPIFHNLTHLETCLASPCGWTGLVRLLRCSPKLEVLIVSHDDENEYIEHMEWTTPNSACLLNKLKRMEIESLQGCPKELDFLGYILNNANILELLLLRRFSYFYRGEVCKELKYCEELFSCPRSSEKCEVEVYGDFLSASSKGFNKTTTGDGSNRTSMECRIYGPVPVCNP